MNSTSQNERLEILCDEAGKRLDRWLAQQFDADEELPDMSRNRLKNLILEGQLSVGGATITDPSQTVKPGQLYVLEVPPAISAEPEAQSIPLTVVFEDEHLIVVDKAAGMVVHPAPGNMDGTLVNALLAHCGGSLSGIGGVRRPGIVHRIDKDTSGLLVVAKSGAAHAGLSAQFAAHDLEREYHTLVWGHPRPTTGRIEQTIGRHPGDRKKMAVVNRGGKHSVTHYRTLARYDAEIAMLACTLETGRTHQIRVHMAYLGFPVIGDPIYTSIRRRRSSVKRSEVPVEISGFRRQALHAAVLGFLHPVDGSNCRFESPLPEDMLQLLAVLKTPGSA
jgi:23S rRNA pseudouridine1911/1915/1917 synthase